MLLILKLPLLYLGAVCYWAIKAEPKPLEGARLPVPVAPGPRTPTRRPRRRSPHGGPRRREARVARAARVGPVP
jgi:hypothetical protein